MALDLAEEIKRLKKQKDAVIAAHNYQIDEVQEIADQVGDSFALSRYCANIESPVIVFCGVHFMAESAKILSPWKTVLLPEKDAGCPMADMVTASELREMKRKHPDAAVVCYINTSAEVKAESDICCTSSNAVDVVRSVPQDEVIFIPDENLADYVAKKVPEKRFIFWQGYCMTHNRVDAAEAARAKEENPGALMLAHPECKPEVLVMADFVGSTKQIIEYANKSSASRFIIGTEMGVLYKLKKDNPGKHFVLLSSKLVCPNMKKTSLRSVYKALDEMKYKIELDEKVRLRACAALERMLRV